MTKRKIPVFHYGWAVLAMSTLCVFGALGLGRFGYSMILPNMQADLGIDNGQAGFLATTGLIGYLALAIIGGALASKYGVRMVASVGLFLTGFGMLAMGLARSFAAIAWWSGLAGIGSGTVNVAIMGLLPSWFTPSKRGLASGVAVSGSSLGLISTGMVVPWITSIYGNKAWHFNWILFGITTLALTVGSMIIIRNKPSDLGLEPIGEGKVKMASDSKPQAGWKQVYFSTTVWYLGLVYVAFGFSYIVFMTFFVKHLVADAGFSGSSAGRLFTLMGWFSLPSGIIWGLASDYIGRKRTLVILYLIHSLAFALFALGHSVEYFAASAILYGISAWSIPAIMAAACGDMLGPEQTPAALGFITLFFGLGQVVGPVIAGTLADMQGSFTPVFLLSSLVALAGAVSAGMLIKTAQPAVVTIRN